MKFCYSQYDNPHNNDYFFEAVKTTNFHFPELKIHSHDYYEIYVALASGLRVQIEDEFFEISEGDVIIFPPHIHHNINPSDNMYDIIYDRTYLWISDACLRTFNFSKWDFSKLFQSAADAKKYIFRGLTYANYSLLVTLLTEMHRSKNSKTEKDKELHYRAKLLTILTMLYSQIEESLSSSSGGIEDTLIRKVITYIDTHFLEAITIDSASEKFNINKNTLERRFKKITNMTIHEYQNHCKIKSAKEKIMSGVNLSDVCYAVGFSDYSTFYRVFQKSEGISPKEFLKNLG